MRPEVVLTLMTAAVAIGLGAGAGLAAVFGPAWLAVLLALMAMASAFAAELFRRAIR